jgi:hypothetical protein
MRILMMMKSAGMKKIFSTLLLHLLFLFMLQMVKQETTPNTMSLLAGHSTIKFILINKVRKPSMM